MAKPLRDEDQLVTIEPHIPLIRRFKHLERIGLLRSHP
jgi:hypothetical protein